MIPEIGHFALIVACLLAMVLGTVPFWGAVTGNGTLMGSARPLALTQFALVLLAFACLSYAFASNDFTVAYVAANSNSSLPWYYRLSAVWGAHEGSLLLWVLILAGWTAAVALLSRSLPLEAVARVLAVMGLVGTGFYLFILLTSNPFTRTLPMFPVDGRDLNPLLQDPGLIFHPPMLYMGYVGFSVAFAFAVAALTTGRLDAAWARWSRPWTTAAWVFLTLGITLGSWWAYYELGWGGWWFWDPVENASLMPWLAGTALIHSLAVTEKRGVFKLWTVLMAITAFSLSLLGTFLVRSGVLVSVHAFASDPGRGLFILGFLLLVVGGSLLLFAVKGAQVKSAGSYQLVSRETALMANNVLLLAALTVVLLGTLLPLVHKQLGLGSISIGAPFFNQMFTWLVVPFALALGVAPLLRWRKDRAGRLLSALIVMLLLTAAGAAVAIALLAPRFKILAWLGLWLGSWIAITTLYEIWLRARSAGRLGSGLARLGRSHWAMVMGHLGLAATITGIALTQNYSIERDLRMQVGDSVQFAEYQFRFAGIEPVEGANFDGHSALILVSRNGREIARLDAQKRFYRVQRSVMTEAAIDASLGRDLYAALGEQLDNGAWAVRLYYKPFVRWIWLGGVLMALGGVLAISDKRYRLARRQRAPSVAPLAGNTESQTGGTHG